jgi:hypothetical protein
MAARGNLRQLHAAPAFADRFLTHMLTRNIRIEEDLVDQLFNSTEKRLARVSFLTWARPYAGERASGVAEGVEGEHALAFRDHCR